MSITQQGWRAGTSGGGGGGSDEKVKISSADTTTNFLENKLVAGANITLNKLNAGANEQIEIVASGGGGGLTSVPIENTLYVSKNGNDGTGQRNDLSKPFLTIAGANGVAQAGDCVYVYAGTYAETGDTFSSNVFYHLEDGVTVTNSGSALVFDDGVTPKIINIFGNGRLACASGTCVDLQVSTANIQCYSITGVIGMILGDTSNIRVYDSITSTSGSAIDLRNDASGYIEFDTLNAQGGSNGILANTSTNDNIYIKGRLMSAEPSKGVGYGFNLANTGNQVIGFEIVQYKQTNNSELTGLVTSGKYYFRDTIFTNTTGNAGFHNGDTGMAVAGGELEFQNCAFKITDNYAIHGHNTTRSSFINCQFEGGVGYNALLSQSAQMYFQDCVLKTVDITPTSGANILTASNLVTLVLANCQLINRNAGGGGRFCLENTSGSNCNLYIQGNVIANFPPTANWTNIIAGTNIIVDQSVIAIPLVTNPI